jgi:hypothetical protein
LNVGIEDQDKSTEQAEIPNRGISRCGEETLTKWQNQIAAGQMLAEKNPTPPKKKKDFGQETIDWAHELENQIKPARLAGSGACP